MEAEFVYVTFMPLIMRSASPQLIQTVCFFVFFLHMATMLFYVGSLSHTSGLIKGQGARTSLHGTYCFQVLITDNWFYCNLCLETFYPPMM